MFTIECCMFALSVKSVQIAIKHVCLVNVSTERESNASEAAIDSEIKSYASYMHIEEKYFYQPT